MEKQSKFGTKIILGAFIVLFSACIFAAPALADTHSFDGFKLTNVQNNTIKGELFISEGTNSGLQGTSYQPNSFTTTITVPSHNNGVDWAKLYVGVWGGKETYLGYADISYGNNNLGNFSLDITNNTDSDVTCSGKGVWLIGKEITNSVSSGNVVVTVNTTNSTSPKFDGRVYGAVLVAALKDTSKPMIKYWVNDGNLNLNYKTPTSGNITDFNGIAYLPQDEAKTTLGILAGDEGHPDYAYLNAPDAADSPYTLSELGWNISKYRDYQLGNADVADEAGDTTKYFDLDSFTTANSSNALKDVINLVGSNHAIFRRGYDTNDDGVINSGYYDNPKEGESYYSPYLATLTLKNIARVYDFSNTTPGVAGTDHFAYEKTDFDGNISVVNLVDSATVTYSQIESCNSVKYQTAANDTCYAAQRFKFEIDETDAQELKVTWNGTGSGETNGATLYLWNDNTNTYDNVASSTTSGVIELTYTENTSPAYYIDSGFVNVLVVQNSATTSTLPPTTSTLQTDYVRLKAIPNVT